VINYGLSD